MAYDKTNRDNLSLSINGVRIIAEIADCPESRTRGLMHRLTLAEDEGMFFIFPDVRERSFWMKETYLPLSIAYIDTRGRIVNIEKMTPLDLTSIKSTGSTKYALEMNEGWFERNRVYVGDTIRLVAKRHRIVS